MNYSLIYLYKKCITINIYNMCIYIYILSTLKIDKLPKYVECIILTYMVYIYVKYNVISYSHI